MSAPIKLLITDLDNTLYDWVTYFSASFYSMIDELSRELEIDPEILLPEFREVHRFYENTEQPFAITEVPSILRRFPNRTQREMLQELNSALHAFNKKRKETLKLYEGVAETLFQINSRGITIIAHTESTVHNALFRLEKLDIKHFFKHLYSLEGRYKAHPIEEKNTGIPSDGFVMIVPKIDRKPNPGLLRDICEMEGVSLGEAAYVGDSITRDISMANEAGVLSIWARYGKSYSKESWDQLVKVTHWSQADVERESLLRDKYSNIEPDFTIDSFSEVLKIIEQKSTTNFTNE